MSEPVIQLHSFAIVHSLCTADVGSDLVERQ